MLKRGQVSMFLVLGLVLLILIILFFSFKDSILSKISSGGNQPLNIEKQLESKISSVSDKINSCTKDLGLKTAVEISKNGGYSNVLSSKMYFGNKVSVLCSKIEPDKLCYNSVPSRKFVESEISKELKTKLADCINLGSYRTSDIDVKGLGLNVTSEIGDEFVIVNVNYPVIVSKNNQKLEQDEFTAKIDYPLGIFLDIAGDIVNEESTVGMFNIGDYNKNLGWIIDPRSLDKDTVYRLTDMNQKEEFWFDVQK